MAKPKPQKAQSVAPNYLTSLGITPPDLSGIPSNWSPGTAAAIKQYFAPGGGFQQTLNTEMVPTGQGGYTAAPGYQNVAPPPPPPHSPPPISYPVGPAPGGPWGISGGPIMRQPTPIPQPVQPPPPPQAKMDWSGLSGSLQSLLAPYLSGGQTGGNPMGQIMPALMKSLGGYLGQLQPTMAGQQAAANQTSLDPNASAGQGSMNWGALGGLLGGLGGAGTTGGGTQGQLMQQLLGYLGTLPNTATGQGGANQTALGAMNQNVPQYAMGGRSFGYPPSFGNAPAYGPYAGGGGGGLGRITPQQLQALLSRGPVA